MASGSKGSNGASNTPGAVGQGDYQVQPGDCMESIAHEQGFLWQTLWNLSENAELKRSRDPNVLLPGDRVTIPAIRIRQVECATDLAHKFQLLGVRTRFRLRFLDDRQQPRNGMRYLLTIDGKTKRGTLDNQGGLDVPISSNASQGTIRLQTEQCTETYPLDFGQLDPDSAVTGLRGRLNNLGFSCGEDGDWDEDLRTAVVRFQLARDLPPTGQFDDATRQALAQDHQS